MSPSLLSMYIYSPWKYPVMRSLISLAAAVFRSTVMFKSLLLQFSLSNSPVKPLLRLLLMYTHSSESVKYLVWFGSSWYIALRCNTRSLSYPSSKSIVKHVPILLVFKIKFNGVKFAVRVRGIL